MSAGVMAEVARSLIFRIPGSWIQQLFFAIPFCAPVLAADSSEVTADYGRLRQILLKVTAAADTAGYTVLRIVLDTCSDAKWKLCHNPIRLS